MSTVRLEEVSAQHVVISPGHVRDTGVQPQIIADVAAVGH